MTATALASYTTVCAVGSVPLEGGVAALVGGEAVALFRTHDGVVFALGNHDPCSDAPVLSRGIVGTRGDAPVVSSPMYKQAFDLRTGRCLDDPGLRVPTYDVVVVDGRVLVGDRRPDAPADPAADPAADTTADLTAEPADGDGAAT